MATSAPARKQPLTAACANSVFALPRTLVSQNKRRFKQGGFDLDLCYLHPRVIVMGALAVTCARAHAHASVPGAMHSQPCYRMTLSLMNGRLSVRWCRVHVPEPAVRGRALSRVATSRDVLCLQLLRREGPMVRARFCARLASLQCCHTRSCMLCQSFEQLPHVSIWRSHEGLSDRGPQRPDI